MTAPSNANTSGLEVVAWLVTAKRKDASFRYWCFDNDAAGRPAAVREAKKWGVEPVALVTAASAQARIDAAEARADGLAKALEALEAERKREGVNLAHLKRAVAVAYADITRAALQQETQP